MLILKKGNTDAKPKFGDVEMEINENTEYSSYMWFKNQEFNMLDAMVRYFLGEVEFRAT